MAANDMTFNLYKTKATKKSLVLELSEGEDILACIEQSMRDNHIDIVEVLQMDGIIKEGTITYFSGNNFRSKSVDGKKPYEVSGRYEIKKGKFTGNCHIVFKENISLLTASPSTLVATDGFKVVLSFHEVQVLNPRTEELTENDIEKGV